MRGQLSILGLYNFDPSTFDGLTVPAGLERDILIDYILMECADLEVLYPNLELMRELIKAWATARRHSWERLYQSTIQQYNMIHNYDRYEDWTDTGNRSTTGIKSGTIYGTDSSESSSSSTGRTQTKKAAYNIDTSDPLKLIEQVDSTGSVSGNAKSTNNSSSSENTTESVSDNATRSGHAYGNIGVTTAAQMISAESELYKWDVYQAIAQEFKQRFCILVY